MKKCEICGKEVYGSQKYCAEPGRSSPCQKEGARRVSYRWFEKNSKSYNDGHNYDWLGKLERPSTPGYSNNNVRAYWKGRYLKTTYGIDLVTFNEMMLKQKSRCAICKRKTNLNVDHDHKTGAIRDLLCNKCNPAIGLLNEDIKTVRAVIKYLKKHKK